ncbi:MULTISPECIES: hypothetical protein [Methylobacterium]|jgi:hypothetical protein|uniref:Uncharacterized protein n=1 Tax=Methylobacterium longum TaxID=767694 RepID=A0ABT8AL64_9HYPH|nr:MULTISPECIES: hypothetical protein [Methylobacterium]MCJ2101686.1 hypothetical protein [Methylobacterium sp. E-046]MDN3570609.1 hypothetical protein [Methylobacterium longum]GJE09752.1 hypothetical protein FOHLNKBM_0779 [Methylobacterium longum]
MTDMTPIADEAATRFAFSLLRSAYLDLAQTLLRIDAEPARELLQAVEHRITYRLGSLATDGADGLAGETTLAAAAGQVRAVLRDAQAP